MKSSFFRMLAEQIMIVAWSEGGGHTVTVYQVVLVDHKNRNSNIHWGYNYPLYQATMQSHVPYILLQICNWTCPHFSANTQESKLKVLHALSASDLQKTEQSANPTDKILANWAHAYACHLSSSSYCAAAATPAIGIIRKYLWTAAAVWPHFNQ